MKTETTLRTNTKQRLALTFGIVAFILAIPLVAMQFTSQVNWKLIDFIVMGILLSITGLTIELVTRKVRSTNWKVIITLSILLILFLIWAELAVGIFGTAFAGS